MPKVRWEVLPYLGGSKNVEGEKVRSRHARPKASRTPSQVDAGLSRSQTQVAHYAAKDEEDIVKDYNSPVHMWVWLTTPASGEHSHIGLSSKVCVGHYDIVPPRSRHIRPNGLHVQYLRHRNPVETNCSGGQ